MALTENEKNLGSLTKQKKKKKTKLDETQLPVFSTTRKLIRQQQLKKGAPRFGGGSPATDYGKIGMEKPMEKALDNTKKSKTPAVIKKATIYKSNSMTGSPYGNADLAGKGRRGSPKGNIGKVQRITEDTKYGGMQMNKQDKLKTVPKKKPSKKKSRGLVTMTSMQNKYL
jgi:hypothetical protein|tara:strand:+ start:61 stop:570 length:510 start_codon:yes stop_codon:yes gene_type:complete